MRTGQHPHDGHARRAKEDKVAIEKNRKAFFLLTSSANEKQSNVEKQQQPNGEKQRADFRIKKRTTYVPPSRTETTELFYRVFPSQRES